MFLNRSIKAAVLAALCAVPAVWAMEDLERKTSVEDAAEQRKERTLKKLDEWEKNEYPKWRAQREKESHPVNHLSEEERYKRLELGLKQIKLEDKVFKQQLKLIEFDPRHFDAQYYPSALAVAGYGIGAVKSLEYGFAGLGIGLAAGLLLKAVENRSHQNRIDKIQNKIQSLQTKIDAYQQKIDEIETPAFWKWLDAEKIKAAKDRNRPSDWYGLSKYSQKQ